jgi:uncharacterized protein YlxW (UPF0749 family)
LTKLFVGLHVLLSAMLVAGVIVFVNKQVDFTKSTAAAEARASRAEKQRLDEVAAMTNEIASYQKDANTLAGRIDTLKSQLATAQQANNTAAASTADLSSKLAMAMTENTKLAEGIAASQAAQGKLNDALATLRTEVDTRVAQGSQLNSRISELTNSLEVTERERRFLAEQLAQARSQSDKLQGQLQQLGVQPEEFAAKPGTGGLIPPINGVVRDVDQIAGSMFASISVGSADSVQKGMNFKIIERGTGKYLGELTVTAVEANEATGRISGPAPNAVQPGAEVKTHL